jgi:hypothetical protein
MKRSEKADELAASLLGQAAATKPVPKTLEEAASAPLVPAEHSRPQAKPVSEPTQQINLRPTVRLWAAITEKALARSVELKRPVSPQQFALEILRKGIFK